MDTFTFTSTLFIFRNIKFKMILHTISCSNGCNLFSLYTRRTECIPRLALNQLDYIIYNI